MFDQNTGKNQSLQEGTSFAVQKWCSEHVEKEVMRRDPETGRLTACYGYYDPEIDYKHYFGTEERGVGFVGLGLG